MCMHVCMAEVLWYCVIYSRLRWKMWTRWKLQWRTSGLKVMQIWLMHLLKLFNYWKRWDNLPNMINLLSDRCFLFCFVIGKIHWQIYELDGQEIGVGFLERTEYLFSFWWHPQWLWYAPSVSDILSPGVKCLGLEATHLWCSLVFHILPLSCMSSEDNITFYIGRLNSCEPMFFLPVSRTERLQ